MERRSHQGKGGQKGCLADKTGGPEAERPERVTAAWEGVKRGGLRRERRDKVGGPRPTSCRAASAGEGSSSDWQGGDGPGGWGVG